MKIFLRQHDERLMAESNKIYKIAFWILTIGIGIDLYYGIMYHQVAFVNDIALDGVGVRPLEFAAFMIALVFCIIMQTRKGIFDTGKYNEVDSDPIGYFVVWAVVGALAVFAGIAILRSFAEYQLVGFENIHWLANSAMALFTAIPTFLAIYVALFLNFRTVKAVQRKEESKLDSGD